MLRASERKSDLDPQALRHALLDANLPTLLMVLFHLTADHKWLEDPYRPTRTRGMTEHTDGGLSPEVQAEIRDAAATAILDWNAGEPALAPTPDLGLLLTMTSVCMGEPVPEEYAEFMAAALRVASRPPPRASTAPRRPGFRVAIVGAGVSGLAAAVRLREAGLEPVVLEQSTDLGGTWRDNRYPGCGVDTPSYLYSYSFFPRNWSHYFGRRDEVISYLHELADEFDLHGYIELDSEVVAATYHEDTHRWRLEVESSDGRRRVVEAEVVLTAVGLLSRPKMPDLPGMADFEGPLFHSAQWPEGLDVTGKRVAVIGTGASAMQIVPAVVDQVAELTVFQRSPQWVAPNENMGRLVPDGVHWLMEHVPFYHPWYRFRLAWVFNDKTHASLQVDPDWPHLDRSLNEVNEGHRRLFTRYLLGELADRPDLQAKAVPKYPPFGKRMLLDNGWYAALRRPNAHLVAEEVVALTTDAVVTASGAEHAIDVVVLATGFDATRLLQPLIVRGRAGIELREVWGDDDATAYLGMSMPGFPNLFFMYGPNTNSGAGGSYIFIAECQLAYLVDLLVQMADRQVVSVECRQEVHDDYVRRVDDAHSRMVWTHPGMTTYYRNARGRVVANSPWRLIDYWKMTRRADLDDYDIVGAREPSPAPA